MSDPVISATDPHPRKRVELLGTSMSYVDTGAGDPVVFLHGNPTSSYLWRNIIPYLQPRARCVAPDLIGCGDSGKSPSGSYRIVDHILYLDEFLDAVVPSGKVTLVIHDWGSALGFHWARRHRERVKGICYMEALVRPLTWEEWSKPAVNFFKALRTPAGEEMILERNLFVERVLLGSISRKLSDEEMNRYRKPFVTGGESRRPMLTWPREIPFEGEPGDVAAIIQTYANWLAKSPVPKLFVNADPGTILIGAQREFCRGWPNQREVTVKGLHFIQEDSAQEIGKALAEWYSTI
ncbi:MAG TPA: haloalkane dehalogenase [Candidatus Binataceae bacterium]|nr:haloalkane dehalogenase [Candidatus Binataceae bacterium]